MNNLVNSMTVPGKTSVKSFWQLAQARANAGYSTALRQAGEALILYLLYGVGPGYYQLAAFWDPAVTWDEKTHHISARSYRKKLLGLNRRDYRKLSQNKLCEKSLFAILGLPSPRYLGHYQHATGQTADGSRLTGCNDLYEYLDARRDLHKLCFKGIEGWGGASFEAVEIIRKDTELSINRLRTQTLLTVSDFCKNVLDRGPGAPGCILEEFLVQHDHMAVFNPSSMNTIRAWVLQQPDDSAQVLLAYLRIGRRDAIVDNQSSGGIVAPIDLTSGVLGPAIDGTPKRHTFEAHPDHGAAIRGRTIPFFHEALQLAKRSVLEFPNIKFAGVDVAIARDGPQIIELNVSPDREGAAFTGVPVKRYLR